VTLFLPAADMFRPLMMSGGVRRAFSSRIARLYTISSSFLTCLTVNYQFPTAFLAGGKNGVSTSPRDSSDAYSLMITAA